MQGVQLPNWSRSAAQGLGNPYPSGSQDDPRGQVRDAHNGTFVLPPDDVRGVFPNQIVAYKWDGSRWVEVPVQVDERYPHHLANAFSNFGRYSGTDEELAYEWDIESWKKVAGRCEATYDPAADPSSMKGDPLRDGVVEDPARRLDDDDEIVFMWSDAGQQGPANGPAGVVTNPGDGYFFPRQEIVIQDPVDPTNTRYLYLFLRTTGPSFDATNGHVSYQRDANADQWIDERTFLPSDPEKLGSSNKSYGPNLDGTVCTDDPSTTTVETQRTVDDRFPRDGVTVTSNRYRFYASGRWMVRELQVRDGADVGEDLIDRWKGRAFQQSPDSAVSLVGFEDEQVNWEANSALLGERFGPVRAIRETWGADSGTNTTKREYFYRDLIIFRYFLRVHPIPPDGLYTSWDHNHDTVARYYNEQRQEDGFPIDGRNDDVGQIDEVPLPDPIGTRPAYFDVTDPTFQRPLAIYNWEQVAGTSGNGSVVYLFQMNNVQGAENPTIIPYYRDDACFDDGTGDDPVPRPWPGEAQSDSRLDEYENTPCKEGQIAPSIPPIPVGGTEGTPTLQKQGCFGCHGVHFLITHDTDNSFVTKPTTEVDGQQYQWMVPTEEVVGDRYANTVKFPLLAFSVSEENSFQSTAPPQTGTPSSTSTSARPTKSPNTASPRPSGSGSTPSPTPSRSTEPPFSPEPSRTEPATGSTFTTLSTSKTKTGHQRPFELSGRVTEEGSCGGPYFIDISKRRHGQTGHGLVRSGLPVSDDGFWSTTLRSSMNATYVAKVRNTSECDGQISSPVDVMVWAKVVILESNCRRVSGEIRPDKTRSEVVLKKRGERWTPVDRSTVKSGSTFTLRVPRCLKDYMVVWPRQGEENLKGRQRFRARR